MRTRTLAFALLVACGGASAPPETTTTPEPAPAPQAESTETEAPPEEADLRALWVAGLICPLPGLAIEPRLELELECRPAILNAGTTLERVEAARLGIQRCIERLREL